MSISRRDHTVLKQIITMANTLVSPAMDAFAEDGSLQGDQVADELAVSVDQCIGI